MASHSESESQITTDRQTIESWAEDANVVPARRKGEERPSNLVLVEESNVGGMHETVSWDEFFSTMEDQNMVVVAHEGDRFEVLDHDEAMGRATVESDELKQALVEGEVVTSTITETTVIERTVVEEAEIESQIADRDQVESSIQNAELLTRDVESCDVTDRGAERHESIEYEQFEPGTTLTDEFDVEVIVNESWDLTREVLERLTIESQIVDTEATETDTVEADEIESTIDIEGVQQTILESELIDTEATTSEVIESGSIHTEFGEGDVFETELMERKTIEEELSLQKEFSGTITDGETVSAETISRETIESAIVDEEGATLGMEEATTREEAVVEEETEMGDTGAEEGRLVPTQDEEGKSVVDATGEEVGLVVEVENETMFVDPHPSITDKIKTALDWGGHNEDAYPVTASQVSQITDDTVELEVEGETRD
ncbi:hypothetical protein ACFR9U_15375 [Halorientalis brevis]|uniref:Uncharacterized protein n=1 Tax=Halorientalis brevis TaxID=1126241 RepID=A0ABD6CDI6_9EURY|nr:hypothetical protein [Halorientalis brevis]